MATGIATCVIAGNITKDAELNASGRVCSFSVAVNRREREQGSEEWGEVASFFDCKKLGNGAEPLSKILAKGTKVTVLGDLVQERWETEDGSKRSVVRILAREVVLGGSGARVEDAPDREAETGGW